MKQNFLKLTCCAAAAAVALAVSAGDDKHCASSTQKDAGCDESHMTMQGYGLDKPVLLSKLQSAKVTSNEDENLGEVEELLPIDPQTGKIQFVILSHGGFLGIGEKYVAVPWKAFDLKAENQFTLNVDKERLKSAPTLERSSDYSKLEKPEYIVTIYRFYSVPVETFGGSDGIESDIIAPSDTPEAVGGSDDIESPTDTGSASKDEKTNENR